MSEEKENPTVEEVLKLVKKRDPNQDEFYEAVEEVLHSLTPLFEKEPKYLRVLPIICEPERVIQFRVPWFDDKNNLCVNRGFRVQFNQAIGPYKGGLRFHSSVNLSIIKFLGFEQIFKNSLTGLPMGGGKGGSDFNPKGKSNSEVLRFCQSFMTELNRYIGPDTDVPAGDIGVGAREIGYLYGQWKRLTSLSQGVLTGKGLDFGGSNIRTEATGYGLVYITDIALKDLKLCKNGIKGLNIAISGAGNVAQYAALKCIQLGGKVITMSDSTGGIIEKNGLTKEQWDEIKKIKDNRKRIYEYKCKNGKYVKGSIWKTLADQGIKIDLVLPCATQNEITEELAKNLVNKCQIQYVSEGANMPSTQKAIEIFRKLKLFIPAKASNAGGVAVSGLEMAQNSEKLMWSREDVDKKLYDIMNNIYSNISLTAKKYGKPNDLQFGANAAGFLKVANAMFQQGMVM